MSLEEIRNWIDQWATLPDISSKNEFSDFGLELGNRARLLMIAAASTCHPNTNGHSKDEAIIVGLHVRLYKLYDCLCLHFSLDHEEICNLFFRLIEETLLKMRYLIRNGKDSVRNYVLVSYKPVRELYDFIIDQGNDRPLWPVEERLLWKLNGQLANDGITIEELRSVRNWKLDGKDSKALWNDVYGNDGRYHMVFGIGSHAIHGDWKDINCYHLEKTNDYYLPKIDYDKVDLRVLAPITIRCLEGTLDFLIWNETDPDKYLENLILQLRELAVRIDSSHEDYITQIFERQLAKDSDQQRD